MNLKSLGKLLASIVITQAAGLVGAVATFSAVTTWYKTLVKPPFSPPNWVFGPVWTVLYILMGVSLYLVWDKGLKTGQTRVAVWLFFIQLAVNVGWSVVFFGLHSIAGALIVLLLLWVLIALLIRRFYKITRWAGYLLLPYILWVTFAGVLNLSLVLLNR